MSDHRLSSAYLFCYPWDFADEGLDEVIGRAADLGVTHLAVASHYHAGYFFYPHNPRRKVHLLEDGVAYFHPHEDCYAGGPLRAQVAAMCGERDWLAEICAASAGAGLRVCAWTVLMHNTRLGLAHPPATVHNVFGDSYPHALSPGHPAAAAFTQGLAADLATHYPLDSIMLEAHGYRGRAHGGAWVGGHHHERQGTHLRELERYLLDLSFNDADVRGAAEAGVDVAGLRRWVRSHVERYLAVAPDAPAELAATVEEARAQHPELQAYERYLQSTEAGLLALLRRVSEPHGVRLMGVADPAIDIVMTGAYGEEPAQVRRITETARASLTAEQELIVLLRMGFYGRKELGTAMVTEEQTAATVGAVAAGGATAVGFYNYGEAPRRCVDWIAPALRQVGLRQAGAARRPG